MKLTRRTYADHFGPTTGDRVRLADTELIVRVEHDFANYGDEAKFGGGKSIRDGMGQSPTVTRDGGAPDLVITSVLIIDWTGIYKADVGIRDGRISAIGKSGNSGTMDGVTAGLEIGAATEVLSAVRIRAPFQFPFDQLELRGQPGVVSKQFLALHLVTSHCCEVWVTHQAPPECVSPA